MLHIARKFDVAARDERNRALGRAGGERMLAHERAALKSAGRDDLARKVRCVSEEDGDGTSYDIASFAMDGRPRLIEDPSRYFDEGRLPFESRHGSWVNPRPGLSVFFP